MGRYMRNQRPDSRDRRNGNHNRWRNYSRQSEYSGRNSFQSRGGIRKLYRNNSVTSQTITRIRGEHKDQRQSPGGKSKEKRYTGTDSSPADNVIKRKGEDIRTILAGPQNKDSCEVSVILGVNLEKAKTYLKEATGNENRLKRCLNRMDKAFKSETTTASKANLINAMTETEFVHNTVDILNQYFESKTLSEEDISSLEAVCALLRIMICVCELNPSALAFIFGSCEVIRGLVTIIRNSMAKKIDMASINIPSKGNLTTKSSEAENEKETDSDCLQSVCSPTNNEGEGADHDSSVICLTDNEKSRKETLLTEKSNFLEKANTSFANLEQLFAELDETVKLCSSRRKKQMQHEPVESGEISDENFRDIPIYPRLGDLNGDINPNLRVHKAKGSYSSVDDYLDVQFRLLREDFVEPLREGINSFIEQTFGKTKKKVQEIKVYENTQILSAFCGDGVNHILSFDTSKLRHVQWNMTKRLKYGSLVCLSANNFQTCYFAAIVDSEAKFRRQGRLHVKFAHVPTQIQELVGSTFTMIESTAYFESYRPVLSSLQTIKENDLPFKEYIIRCQNDVSPPKYLQRETSERTLDLRCLLNPNYKIFNKRRMFILPEGEIFMPNLKFSEDSNILKKVNILERKWPMEDKLQLDSSQLNALKSALTREFSVIQGPPGCGKTHLGLKIAKVLLYNKNVWEHENGARAQMLVVCYTNHALDQFMEGICSFFKGDIVRVGSRSCNETMAKFNYKSIKKECRKLKSVPRYIRCAYFDAKSHADILRYEINLESEKIKLLREHIVHEKSLSDAMSIDHYQQFKWLEKRIDCLPPWLAFLGNASIVEWLGIVDMAKKIQNEIHYENQRKDDQNFESLLNKELNIENREAMTEINFDFKQQLEECQQIELTSFRRKNISLDFDEINNLDGQFFSDKKRKVVERERRKLTKTLQYNLRRIKPMSKSEAVSVVDILSKQFTQENRWALYLFWVQTKCYKIYQSYERKLELYEHADARVKDVDRLEEKFIFQNADIIGMTITGAAKHKTVLREIKPTIMIVEEAAEVLESHMISNLTSGCEQLIMIGDHKQLKPKPNVYRLEREYNLDISLFERMIRNGIRFDCLQIQHRMRPEIADNVRHLYGTLLDHESVKQFETIKGIAHSIYFIDHCVEERKDEELKSYTNIHEVQYITALCKYLLLQGYNASNITILTTYKGQMYIMKKEMLVQGNVLKGVRMTIVDNYQGEENDIILLSLVRSNESGIIGYLARDNRVCVALSRAKKGFYIIGNGTSLSSASNSWKQILNSMQQKGFVGKALPLRCQNHTEDAGIMAKYPEDFHGAPEGGCRKLCNIRLDCGHACGRFCHIINKEHTGVICKKPCARKCKNGHVCKRVCFQECHCEENIIVTLPDCGHIIEIGCSVNLKVFTCDQICNKRLACGHVCIRRCQYPCVCMEPVNVHLSCGHGATIPCSINPAIHKCNEIVQVLHSDCGHIETIKCCDASKPITCKIDCKLPLDCGHLCKNMCDAMVSNFDLLQDDSLSKCPRGHISYCEMSCKTILKCGHACEGSCSTCFKGRWHKLCEEKCNCNLICGHNCMGKCGYCLPCTEDYMRNCSHRIYRKRCMEEFIACTRTCSWKCKHYNCTQLCGENCDRPRCNKPCKKFLPCKHECIGMCGDPCPKLCRICNKDNVTEIHYGAENLPESRFVQLQDCGHVVRYDIMDEYMDIDEGVRLKRCPLCNESIRTTRGNRYENIVNRIYNNINNFTGLILRDFDLRCTLMKSASIQTKEMIDWITDAGIAICTKASAYYNLNNLFSCLQQPPLMFNFLACRDVVNTLNQLMIFSFLNTVTKSCTTDNDVLFRGASFCLSSPQHVFELEREVKRVLDRRYLEKLEEKFLAHGGKGNNKREMIESAKTVLLKPGLYSEEDRARVLKDLQMFSEAEQIDTEPLNLSFETVAIDRDVVVRKGLIDVTYPLQNLFTQNRAKANYSQGLRSIINEHQLNQKISETQNDSDICTYKPTDVNDSVKGNKVNTFCTVDYRQVVSLTKNSEKPLMEPEVETLKGDKSVISTSTWSVEPVCRHYIKGCDEDNENKDRNVLPTDHEEIEDGEIIENEISGNNFTETGSNKNQDLKECFHCTSRERRRRSQDIEDGEIEDESDMPEGCLEFAETEDNFDTDGNSPMVCAEISDDSGVQGETILYTRHRLSDGSITTNTYQRENVLFGEETDSSTKLTSITDTAKSHQSVGQTHVLKLLRWPDVPYFHREQSTFHLKKLHDAGIQNTIRKDFFAKPTAKNRKNAERVEKKAKEDNRTKVLTSALNNKKRLNNETDETESLNKKIKVDGKVSFTIQTKPHSRVIKGIHFDDEFKDERKQEINIVSQTTDTRNVIITSNKSISNKKQKQDRNKYPSENKTLDNPFVIDKICWSEPPKAAVKSSTRPLVDYEDVDTFEEDCPESEYIYGQKANFMERPSTTTTRKSQRIRLLHDTRGKEATTIKHTLERSFSSNKNKSSSLNKREMVSPHFDNTAKDKIRHSPRMKEGNWRNTLKSVISSSGAVDNNGRRSMHTREKEKVKLKHCTSKGKRSKTQHGHNVGNASGLGKRAPKSRNHLRHVLDKKDCKERSRSLETDELQIEGGDWKVLDTA